MEEITFDELQSAVKDFFGSRASEFVISIGDYEKNIDCILYESFHFSCGLEKNRSLQFGGAIRLGSNTTMSNFYRHHTSLNSDKESVLESLRMIDEHCRAKLPDKFLKRFDIRTKKADNRNRRSRV